MDEGRRDDLEPTAGDTPPVESDDFDFLTAPFDPDAAVEETVEAEAPDPAPRLVAVPELEPEPEPVVAEHEPATEPEPVLPEPVAAVEPEPEAAVEPEPDPEPVPFWKKEISFGGKKKAAAEPKPAKAPKAAKPPRAERRPRRRPEAIEPAADAAQPVPFWKKEVSLGRKHDDAPAAGAPADEPVPFWKKEISLGRKPAGERAKPPKRERPRARRRPVEVEVEAAATPAVAAVAAGEAPTERVPFYKRELSLKRGPRPAKAEQAPKLAKQPKQPKEPKEKKDKAERRQLSLPSLKLPVSVPKRSGKEGVDSKRLKSVVGLKIGASQIAAAAVQNNGHAELVKVARTPLDDGVVAGGELRDPEALTAALKELFNRHKLPKRNVRLGIANNRIGVRTFEIAGIDDEKQLANAIRFRAQEALPIPIEEAVLDWRILGETVDVDGQRVRRILLVVAYRELVDRYVEACTRAGIKLVGIDLEAFALLRALGDGQPRSADDGALVAVSVGHERSTFAVSDGEICEFTRVLEWGGNSLNVAIARALEKAPSEVEALKRGLTLDGTAEELPEHVSEEDAAKAREAVRRQLQTFARELVSSLQFYQNQPGSLGIGEVVLTGGTTQLPGLAQELERLIGVRVRIGDPLARVQAKKLGDEPVASLAVAIGLGIEA